MHVFTNSKAALREAVLRSGARKSVSDFIKDFCRPIQAKLHELNRGRGPEMER
jgi:hypothetical protein